MPEAEEVLTDAARHATIAAQQLWRRWRGERDTVPCWQLGDCRARLELLIEAVLGIRVPVRAAQPAAPASWLARLLRRGDATPAAAQALPANDGVAIYLPPAIGIVRDTRGMENSRDYQVLAFLQALRVTRGSVRSHRECDTPLAADLHLLAEAAAADRALRRLLPGWSAALQALYARTAATLAGAGLRSPLQAEVLALYRALLEQRGEHAIPPAPTSWDSLDWAQSCARMLAARYPSQRYRRQLADAVIGRLLPPEAAPGALARYDGFELPEAAEPRRATLARRPRVRASEEGEDDESPGAWMIQTSEPQEHAEDPLGLSRPQDHEPDSDVQGAAESLSELESARLVSTPGRAAQVLHSADPPPRLEQEGAFAGGDGVFVYPEWDCRAAAYRARAHVHVAPAAGGSPAWSDAVLERHAATLREARRRFGAIRPHRQVLKRQNEGDDIDIDALVDDKCARRAGTASSDAFYQLQRAAPRRIGLLLLIDASGSTDAWIAGTQRVIDVEKEAALVAACALDMARTEFAMLAFSGEGPHGVQVRGIKDFNEPWGAGVMRRLAAIEPDRYTRLGGAVRHASAMLARRAVDARLLLLFSDGKPNDCDRYAGAYGIEDARQALIEARLQHIDPYCFTVDREAGAYLPHLFGIGHYTIVQRAQHLPLAFVEWMRGAAQRMSR